jgi:hypothetical protein
MYSSSTDPPYHPTLSHSISSETYHGSSISDLMNPYPQASSSTYMDPHYPPMYPQTAYPSGADHIAMHNNNQHNNSTTNHNTTNNGNHHITPGSSSSLTHSTPHLHPPIMKTSEYLDPEDGSPTRDGERGERGVKRRWDGEEGGVTVFKGGDPSELWN